MGDLPRWVNRSDVDSSAMLSAFLQYHTGSCQPLDDEHLSFQPSWYGHLCVVIHRDADWVLAQTKVPMPPVIREVPCRQPDCHRCGVRGGYVFRWYSPYWAQAYNELRREGAWRAPQPELSAGRQGRNEYWQQQLRFWHPTVR